MAVTALRTGKAYEKHAWIILFLIGIIASPGIVFGLFSEPRDYVLVFFALGLAVPTILISATSYRKGKKWAWYSLWYVPVVLVISTYQQYASLDLVALVSNILLSAVPVVGLLLPYRKFFPRRQA